jgi:hypothetical protein
MADLAKRQSGGEAGCGDSCAIDGFQPCETVTALALQRA